MTEDKQSRAEIAIKTIVDVPGFILGHLFSTLVAVITDWETFTLTVGTGLLAYATGEYFVFGGAFLIVYSLLRVVGDMVHNHAEATAFHGRVIRDNWSTEQQVAITQLPQVMTTTLS